MSQQNPSIFRQTKKAFSIAEVVLSGFLLTTGIVSVMSLFSVSHRSVLDTQQMIVAAELAQEGVEVARNIRDANTAYRARYWTSGDNCSTSITGNCDPFRNFPNGANQICTANYNSATFNCTNPSLRLGISGSTGLYIHGGTMSRYYRMLKITHTGGADTARIQSFATWQDPGNNLNGATAVSWCTPYNKCVYTELFLSRWK